MFENQPRGRLVRPLLILSLFWIAAGAQARGTYQTPQAFVSEVFSGQVPPVQRLWLSGKLGDTYREVMQEPPPHLRQRYWKQGQRTVWIMQAIGKEHPITAGFVVNSGKLELARVLVFRESRGWEIRYPFFTRQFENAGLADGQRLDTPIDAITGATLSVRAMTNMARMALLLAQEVTHADDTP